MWFFDRYFVTGNHAYLIGTNPDLLQDEFFFVNLLFSSVVNALRKAFLNKSRKTKDFISKYVIKPGKGPSLLWEHDFEITQLFRWEPAHI